MGSNADLIPELSNKAAQIRTDVIRCISHAKSGHPGGSLSIVDILCVLYYSIMRIDPSNPRDPNRDRLVLSKGHGAPALSRWQTSLLRSSLLSTCGDRIHLQGIRT